MHNQSLYRRSDWHVIPLTIADQQLHIERSEQLLAEMVPGSSPALCWSQTGHMGLVLGFSQKEMVVNQQNLSQECMPLYHRRAGGAAVLVGPHLLGLDVVLPAEHPLVLADLVESYKWLGEVWVRALLLLGITTRLVSPSEAHAQRALAKQEMNQAREAILQRACYASNSSYEVVVGTRKVVGLDMIRRRNGSLLQAGALLHWEYERLARLLGHTSVEYKLLHEELPRRAIGLDELLGRTVEADEVMGAFEGALFC